MYRRTNEGTFPKQGRIGRIPVGWD
ncbi:hypothetical protein [Pseudomonas sp. GCEP-101]